MPLTLRHADPAHAKTLLADWCLGTTCNYSCSYCPDSLHDGRHSFPSIATATRFAGALLDHCAALDRRVTFQFTGGEPTLYPGLLPLARTVKERGAAMVVISNASRPLDWWRGAVTVLDAAILTYHVEFATARFADVLDLLSSRIRTHVNVTMWPERFDDCLAAAESLARACPSATFTLKPLLVGFGDQVYPYNEAQKNILCSRRLGSRNAISPHGRGQMLLVGPDPERAERVRPGELIVSGRNRWAGWQCHAGLELLSITPSGDVYRSLCREGGRLATIHDETFCWPEVPIICGKARCHCVTDILTTKASAEHAHSLARPSRP